MKNLNLLFNKSYYERLGTPSFERSLDFKNTEIFNTLFDHARDYSPSPIAKDDVFLLKTTYPGMLVGIGNSHGSHQKDVNTDINSGFSFDYVTGQPYIPGSSVKGVLRSHFENHPEVITEITGCEDVEALTAEIFDGNDIFLDAVVYDGDKNARLIGSDYITPHSSPTKNPVPIFIIKILPDVRFEFRFKLSDSDHMLAADKRALFKTLLVLFGAGAKTNVGYGVLKECSAEIGKKTIVEIPVPKAKDDRKTCPHCRTVNFKYKVNSYDITHNWETKKCTKCGKAFR